MVAPNIVPAIEVVDSLLIREGDLQGINRATYMSVFKDIWDDMNIGGIKSTKRVVLKVNRDVNSITLPEDGITFSTIYGFVNGRMHPLLINRNLSEDIIDLSANKKCDCDTCSSSLCASVKNYELIEEEISALMPSGLRETFTKVTRKKINKDGSYIQETTEPNAVYTGGVHTSTEMKTTTTFICDLKVDEQGCVVDCPDNRGKLYANCGFCDIEQDCGKPVSQSECFNPDLTYNVSEDGRRIIFPSTLSVPYVVARYYYSLKTKDIMIPKVSKRLMILKLKKEMDMFDKKVRLGDKAYIDREIFKEEGKMFTALNMMTLAELYNTMTPKRNLK